MKILNRPKNFIRRHPTLVLGTVTGLTALVVFQHRVIGECMDFLEDHDLLDEALNR